MNTQTLRKTLVKQYLQEDSSRLQGLKDEAGSAKTRLIWLLIASAASIGGAIMISQESRDIEPGVAIGAGIVVAIIFTVLGFRKKNETEKAVETFMPNTKIKSMKVGKLRFKASKVDKAVFFSDAYHAFGEQKIELPTSESISVVTNLMKRYEKAVEQLPAVLPAEKAKVVSVGEDGNEATLFSNESELYDIIQDGIESLANIDKEIIEDRFLSFSDSELSEIKRSLDDLSSDAESVPFDTDFSHREEIAKAKRIEGAVDEDDSDSSKLVQILDDFIERLTGTLNDMGSKRLNSLGGILVGFSSELERMAVIPNFVCYCPVANKEAIEQLASGNWHDDQGNLVAFDKASIMRPVPGTKEWENPVTGYRTAKPFLIHRTLDELVFPAMDHLLQENRIERLRIYQNGEDEKRKILLDERREIRELTEDGECEANSVLNRIRDMRTNVESAKATTDMLMAEMTAFEALAESRLAHLGSEMNQIVTEIDNYRQQSMNAFNSEVERLNREASKEIDKYARIAKLEDEAQMKLQQQMASNMKEVAESSKDMSEKMNTMSDQLQSNSEATAAIAGQQGAYKPKFPSVVGVATHGVQDIWQKFTGSSDFERHRSEIKKK